jgi:hypothetical protein
MLESVTSSSEGLLERPLSWARFLDGLLEGASGMFLSSAGSIADVQYFPAGLNFIFSLYYTREVSHDVAELLCTRFRMRQSCLPPVWGTPLRILRILRILSFNRN